MGDRANFGIKQNDGNIIFVYGHWAGKGMFERFAKALDNNRTPSDPVYGTRIIISQLVGEKWNYSTGWGITLNYLEDAGMPVPVYDFATDTVKIHGYCYSGGELTITEPTERFTRQEFIDRHLVLV